MSNDSFAEAQPLPSAVTLGGWVSGSSARFRYDCYRATLAEGQVVTVAVASPHEADVALEVFVASTVPPELVPPSASDTAATKTVSVPADGEYFLTVFVRPGAPSLQGASNYLLTLGPAPQQQHERARRGRDRRRPDGRGRLAGARGELVHGTHVAGTIGAASDNEIGVAGVSWGAKIMPIRVLGLGGSGRATTSSWASGSPRGSRTTRTRCLRGRRTSST